MTYGNYVGCMTGTSVDGLDLALIEVSPLNRATGEKETIVEVRTEPSLSFRFRSILYTLVY